ncbi:MAG: hypothetical protein GF398_18040 [Chitinivibrionales bacterium]|nr:hypothetical protein [Chitinivibrionales bacterium]
MIGRDIRNMAMFQFAQKHSGAFAACLRCCRCKNLELAFMRQSGKLPFADSIMNSNCRNAFRFMLVRLNQRCDSRRIPHLRALSARVVCTAGLLALFISGLHAQDYKSNGRKKAVLTFEWIASGFSYSHPSNIEMTKNGTMLAVYAGGDSEGENTKIGVSRKAKGAKSWTTIANFSPGGKTSGFDPVIFEPSKAGAPLLLWYYDGCCEKQFMRTSSDDGLTWSSEFRPPRTSQYNHNGGYFEGPEQNPPLEMPDGSLLCSYSVRQRGSTQQNWITKIPADNYTYFREDTGRPFFCFKNYVKVYFDFLIQHTYVT